MKFSPSKSCKAVTRSRREPSSRAPHRTPAYGTGRRHGGVPERGHALPSDPPTALAEGAWWVGEPLEVGEAGRRYRDKKRE